MKKYIKHIIILVTGFLSSATINAQDIHFSQFMEAPLMINPANAGMYSGDYRAILNYKEQWSNINNGYKTYAGSYDMTLFKNSLGQKATGIGLNIFQDVAGTSKTKTTRVDLNLSQTVYLNTETDLTLGIGASYLDISANYMGLLWGNQWNGIEFDQSTGPLESEFTVFGQKAFDLSAGLLFRKFDINGQPLELGFSMYHLTRPKIGVFDPQGIDAIPFRYSFHANKEFNFSRNGNWGGVGMGFANFQSSAREIYLGFLLRRDFGMVSQYTGYYRNFNFYLGGFYRSGDVFNGDSGDAIIIMTKLLVKGAYSIGLSYDFNISRLSAATRYQGGWELSLVYSGLFKDYPVASPKTLR